MKRFVMLACIILMMAVIPIQAHAEEFEYTFTVGEEVDLYLIRFGSYSEESIITHDGQLRDLGLNYVIENGYYRIFGTVIRGGSTMIEHTYTLTGTTEGRDFYIINVIENQYTIQLPIDIQIESTGNVEPAEAEFKFVLLGLEDKYELEFSPRSIKTNGSGSFDGILEIKLGQADLEKLAKEGFTVRLQNQPGINWNAPRKDWNISIGLTESGNGYEIALSFAEVSSNKTETDVNSMVYACSYCEIIETEPPAEPETEPAMEREAALPMSGNTLLIGCICAAAVLFIILMIAMKRRK